MKRLFYSFIFLSLFLITGCQSKRYVLQSVTPHRIEVTKALDKQPVAAAMSFIQPYQHGVDSLRAPRVGESELYMAGGRPESLLSNWVADVLVAAAQRLGYQPDLGICNMGGLRAAMPKGTVTRGDILGISPFENVLSILKLKGEDVQQLMQDIAAVKGEGVSHAARLVITADGQLKSATLNGQPIDPNRTYTIATLDYLAEGNDKLYSLKRSVERTDTKEPVRETLMKHLQLLDAQGKKATAQIEGRVVIEGSPASTPSPAGAGSAHLQAQNGTESSVVITPLPNSVGDGKRVTSFLIVHTNDTHSCIEPLSPLLADTAQADKGGYLRRAALLRDLRQQDKDLLLVDAGDFSQGSAYYSLYHGDVEVGLMNLMGYDAATIGNHEFDWGLENMARIFRMARFPIVCCNYDFTGTPVEGLVKPYVIVKQHGLKIGILGVSPKLEGLVAAHTCEGVRFNDPVQSVQQVADYLKNTARCDLVICLSHLGWNIPGTSDEELVPATRNIDLVIGGHSHTYFTDPQLLQNLDGRTVPVNQMGKNACFVGTLRLTLTK